VIELSWGIMLRDGMWSVYAWQCAVCMDVLGSWRIKLLWLLYCNHFVLQSCLTYLNIPLIIIVTLGHSNFGALSLLLAYSLIIPCWFVLLSSSIIFYPNYSSSAGLLHLFPSFPSFISVSSVLVPFSLRLKCCISLLRSVWMAEHVIERDSTLFSTVVILVSLWLRHWPVALWYISVFLVELILHVKEVDVPTTQISLEKD